MDPRNPSTQDQVITIVIFSELQWHSRLLCAFSLQSFNAILYICSGLISQIHSSISTIWCVNNSPGNYPLNIQQAPGYPSIIYILYIGSWSTWQHQLTSNTKESLGWLSLLSSQATLENSTPVVIYPQSATLMKWRHLELRKKVVEVAKPASRHPYLSDVHITDVEDS